MGPGPKATGSGVLSGAAEELGAAAPSDVYGVLESRPSGLTAEEARARQSRYGPNRIDEGPGRRLLPRLLAQVTHVMAVLLWIAGLLAFIAELPELAIAVWAVNLVNGAFSFWQEYRAERALAALRQLLPTSARVLREGVENRVLADDLVPGDVLLLAEGDRISADARLVEAHELRVDQSTLTGESHPVRRTARPLPAERRPVAEQINAVFAGTMVTSGRGTAVVAAIGMHTEFGAVASITGTMVREQSPLQRELATLSRVVGAIAVVVGLAFFALAQVMTAMPIDRGLVFALGMIVAFVPEGLLPTVTLALAMGTQRMARRQALVKRLSAVEALGSTTVICTDKTGTLTANQMTVRSVFQLGDRYDVTGVGYAPDGALLRDGSPMAVMPTDLRELLWTAACVNDAKLLPPDVDRPSWTAVGDPTEAALLVAARKAGIGPDTLAAAPRVAEWPFDSRRKRMSTLQRTSNGLVVCTKGAPRELVARCSRVRLGGRDVELDDERRSQILAANDGFSREALRVLAVAYRRVADSPDPLRASDDAEQDLTLLGLVAMMDPPRPAVAAAVETCARAGIRILMMTGDYGLTAESVARRIGLIAPDRKVRIVNGDEVDALDDDGLGELLDDDVVLARVTPAHKLRVVTVLQQRAEIVAVTGDGVNDAPALKKADIGVAMGASGTDVAREAADMILLDDDFASIVAAVEEGRAVYANIRKFTGYIFTSNTPEAVPFMLFGLSGGRIPIALPVMHILAVDLGTDLVPALALGAERPEPGVMDRPPRPRDEHVITPALLRRSYLWLGPVQAAAVMLAFFLVYRAAGYEGWLNLPDSGRLYASATAAALAAVTTTQIGNLLAHRTERLSIATVGWTSNRLIWIGVATELVIVAAFIYLPTAQAVIGTAPFPVWIWAPVLGLSPLLLIVDEARKALLRRRARQKERS